MASTNINVRTDSELKAQAEQIFSELGLNMSIAINMFLRQVVRENGIPFDARLKAAAKNPVFKDKSGGAAALKAKPDTAASAGGAGAGASDAPDGKGVTPSAREKSKAASAKEPCGKPAEAPSGKEAKFKASDDPAEKIKDYLDELGRLTQYPSKRKKRIQALCYMADKIPAGRQFTEAEFNAIIDGLHTFHDAAIIRREMYDYGLVERSANGSVYYLIENRPTIKELFKKYCS